VILAREFSFFSFIRRRTFCLGTFWGLFVLWGLSIVQFVLKLANITEQRLHGTFCLFLSSLYFLVLLNT